MPLLHFLLSLPMSLTTTAVTVLLHAEDSVKETKNLMNELHKCI